MGFFDSPTFGEIAGIAGILGGGIATATGVGAGIGIPLMAGGLGILGGSLTNSSNQEIATNATTANANMAADATQATENMQGNSEAFNAAEAQKTRDYQTQMSNTAYQRSVDGMKAAGLNPILAGMNQSSASTPNGATASIGGGSGTSGSAATIANQNAIGAGLSSAIDMRNLMADIDQKQSSAGAADAQAALSKAMASKAIIDAQGSANSAKLTATQQKALESQLSSIAAQAKEKLVSLTSTILTPTTTT